MTSLIGDGALAIDGNKFYLQCDSAQFSCVRLAPKSLRKEFVGSTSMVAAELARTVGVVAVVLHPGTRVGSI